MVKGGWKSVGFLTGTALVLGWEVLASFDGDNGTWPWTDLIVEYVPGEVVALVIGALAAWLPVHFLIRYRRKSQGKDES
jgi:hypothetical protein